MSIAVSETQRTGRYKTSCWHIEENLPICCLATFYPCCASAWTFAESRGESCSIVHICCQPSPIWTRINIRHARGMAPDFYEDCILYTLCTKCSICHDANELAVLKTQRQTQNAGGIEIMELEMESDDSGSGPENAHLLPSNHLLQ